MLSTCISIFFEWSVSTVFLFFSFFLFNLVIIVKFGNFAEYEHFLPIRITILKLKLCLKFLFINAVFECSILSSGSMCRMQSAMEMNDSETPLSGFGFSMTYVKYEHILIGLSMTYENNFPSCNTR